MSSFSSLATPAGVSSIVASRLPCGLVRVEGYFRGGADRWLQFFNEIDPANVASSAAVREYPIPQTAPFTFDFSVDPVDFSLGLLIAISSTETFYTADNVSKMDIQGDLVPRLFAPSDYSVAGDLGTGRDSLQVWANAAGPKSLYHIDYTNGEAGDAYLMLFATDAQNNGDTPIRQWKLATTATVSLDFGDTGWTPMPGGQKGCTLYQSSTAGTLTKTSDAASIIRAFYK